MNISIDKEDYEKLANETLAIALGVKTKQGVIFQYGIRFGVVCNPPLTLDIAKNNHWLYTIIESYGDTVKVIGYGWNESPLEKFVWTGTAKEFCETWEGD